MGKPHRVIIPEDVDAALREFCEGTPLATDSKAAPLDSTVEGDFRFTGETRQRTSLHIIQNETPRHRWVLYLHLQGYSKDEISERTGFHRRTLEDILKQPWAQEFMAKVTGGSTAQRVAMLLDVAAAPAVERLMIEMDNPKARPAERTQAADKLLDRLFGRAVQPILHSQAADPSKLTDAEIERRLAELRETQTHRS